MGGTKQTKSTGEHHVPDASAANLGLSRLRGIAVVDHQEGAAQVAVWLTARDGSQATNVNAVVIDLECDPDAKTKVLSLVHRCAVLTTEGTTLAGLPIDGAVLEIADVSTLLDEVETQQSRILDAIAAHRRRVRSKALVEPTFPERPALEDFVPADDSASQRALATANYVGRSWSAWLKTDEERRRRTVQPSTGTTPWMMPESMNGTTVPDFPDSFAGRLHIQGVR